MISLSTLYHPATGHLIRWQSQARLKRILVSFRSPRRQLVALLALVLGLIWVSQAIATIFFRQAADAEKLQLWLPVGLAAYTGWHLIKLVSKPLEDPFNWTEAEQEFVLASPLNRSQQISYRMISILQAAVAKAVCFSLLMIPDIPIWFLGFAGMLLALLAIDLLRMICELGFHGLTPRQQQVVKVLVLGVSGITAISLVVTCLIRPAAAEELASPGALVFFRNLFTTGIAWGDTDVGRALLAPLSLFTNLMLTREIGPVALGQFALAVAIVVGLLRMVYAVDLWTRVRAGAVERKRLNAAVSSKGAQSMGRSVETRRLRIPWRLGGAGALCWRQLLGAIHYRSTLVFSLTVPIFLSCLPLLAGHEPTTMLIHLVGGSVFYSFLLLPAALMLDYRRDLQRMALLKSLPISPLAITIGQLGAPVLICWMFQGIVLLVGTCVGSTNPLYSVGAWFLLIPVNVLIFAIENYIFLLSPYHRNREGFDVFLRTILTFTGKGILFAVGLALVLTWAWIAMLLIQRFDLGPVLASCLFGTGVWTVGLSLAAFFVLATTKRFSQFDPSQDVPG